MNMQTDSAQAPYDPGKPGIRWNPRPMDPRMVVAAILVAGLAIGGGIAWSGYMQAQAVRCTMAASTLSVAELQTQETADKFAPYGCRD